MKICIGHLHLNTLCSYSIHENVKKVIVSQSNVNQTTHALTLQFGENYELGG